MHHLVKKNLYKGDIMISLILIVIGLAYGIGSKKFRNDRDVFDLSHESLKEFGGIIILIFFASQFISIFKKIPWLSYLGLKFSLFKDFYLWIKFLTDAEIFSSFIYSISALVLFT